MTPQEIQPGTRLELELVNRYGEKTGSTYVSQLLENQDDEQLVISAPIFEARLIYIPIQARIRLIFMHSRHGLLCFEATVAAREFRGKIAVLIIKPEDSIEKIQRRNHYRLDFVANAFIWAEIEEHNVADDSAKDGSAKGGNNTDGNAKVSVAGNTSVRNINAKGSGAKDKKSAIKASTKNISGSGLCIVTETKLQKNTEVDIAFNLTENNIINARCIVVRSNEVEIRSDKKYEIGLRYTKLSPKDQDCIIRYIFEQQRILLKRESQ